MWISRIADIGCEGDCKSANLRRCILRLTPGAQCGGVAFLFPHLPGQFTCQPLDAEGEVECGKRSCASDADLRGRILTDLHVVKLAGEAAACRSKRELAGEAAGGGHRQRDAAAMSGIERGLTLDDAVE